jgi:hypothetical protein
MTTHYSSDDHVERLAHGVIDGSWPKAQWTHAAHFAVALWILRHRPDQPAEVQMPTIIRNYNAATGLANTDASGYHETITLASIRAARSFLGRYPSSQPLHEILDRLMETALGDSRWLLSHWTRDRLFSVAARRTWVAPDLEPLA